MRKVLNQLFEYRTLSRKEAEEVLTNIACGAYSEPEIAAFITVYLMRSISVAELSGFRDALMNLCIKTDLSDFEIVDVCGTGGDGKNSFNISTLVAFVLAGAGLKVAKHGNYAVTSACGSSNILEFLGYKFSTRCDKLRREIDKAGIGFLHAPLFNPAMKNIAPVRKALKIKTFFNMLGPLVNPASPGKQLTGVYSLELARLYNYLFQESGKQYAIVHNLDGYDEISLTSDFKVIMNGIEQIFNPGHLGYERTSPADLHGGTTVETAAGIFTDILQGKGTKAQNSVVVVNAQMAIKCCHPAKSLDECRAVAEESLISGKAYLSLKKLIEMQ